MMTLADLTPRWNRVLLTFLIVSLVGCGGGGGSESQTANRGGGDERVDPDNGEGDGSGGETDSGTDSDGSETGGGDGDEPGSGAGNGEEEPIPGSETAVPVAFTGTWLLACDEGVQRGFKIIGTHAELLERFFELDDCIGTGTDVAKASFDLAFGERLTTDDGFEAHQIDMTYTSEPTELDNYVKGDKIYSIAAFDESGSTLYFGTFENSPVSRPTTLNFLESYTHDAVGNNAPVAQAGSDHTVSSGSTVTLNGSGSFDSDGSLVHYQWSQVSGTTVSLNNASSAIASFTAPDVTTSGKLTFTLTVTDDSGVSAFDTVTVTVVEQGAQSDSDLTAEFTMRIEGPIGTTGGYMPDPISIQLGTSNDHFQNYSPSPEFSWGYHLGYYDLTEEEMNDLRDEEFTEFSTKKTYQGYSFTYEFEELDLPVDTNYVYFRLVIKRPDGSYVRHTKKAVFPMVRAQGYIEIDGERYTLERSPIFFGNADPISDDFLPYTIIAIEDILPKWVMIEVVGHFPQQTLPLSFHQLGDDPTYYASVHTTEGFYFRYGNYATFDDPSGDYSKGTTSYNGTWDHPDVQGTLSLDMTLRGYHGRDKEDEIKARVHLFFIPRHYNNY